MLISVSRDVGPGLLMQGEKSGVHWRAMRDVQTFSIEGPHTVYAVYLQFFIDAVTLGIDQYGRIHINGTPPPYNIAVVGDRGLTLSLATEYHNGSPPHHKMQWVETYYGKLRQSARTGGNVGAELFAVWYPRNRSRRYVDVLPTTFMKYISLSAAYMCNYLSLVADN